MKNVNGQALLELAVFGSIILYLMGILVNYGLRYNWQQRLNQQAFRKNLKDAAHSMEPGYPVSTGNTIIRDVHIPNPADAFGVGSVMPIAGSGAMATRNWRMYDNSTPPIEEASRQVFHINNKEIVFITGENGTVSGFENYTQDISLDNSLNKQESSGGITTTDSFNWQVSTARNFVCENCTEPGPTGDISVVQPDLKTQTFTANW
ncbi:MAG: hypothetical protein ABIH27_01580 [Candidatus Omnitrophota bacterium]